MRLSQFLQFRDLHALPMLSIFWMLNEYIPELPQIGLPGAIDLPFSSQEKSANDTWPRHQAQVRGQADPGSSMQRASEECPASLQ